jgi:DNA-binding transcriptional regulator YiaG
MTDRIRERMESRKKVRLYGRQVFWLRETLCMTQREFADMVGCCVGSIYRWECLRRSPGNLASMAIRRAVACQTFSR